MTALMLALLFFCMYIFKGDGDFAWGYTLAEVALMALLLLAAVVTAYELG